MLESFQDCADDGELVGVERLGLEARRDGDEEHLVLDGAELVEDDAKVRGCGGGDDVRGGDGAEGGARVRFGRGGGDVVGFAGEEGEDLDVVLFGGGLVGWLHVCMAGRGGGVGGLMA